MTDLKTLVARHRELVAAGGAPRALAEIERQLLAYAPSTKNFTLKLKFVAQVVGTKQYEVGNRYEIFRAEPASHVIWEYVERGLPYGTARRLIADARRAAGSRDHVAARRHLEAALAALGYRSPDTTEVRAEVPVPARERDDDDPLQEAIGLDWSTSREFWKQLRKAIVDYVADKLRDADETERAQLLEELETDVGVVLNQHSQKWARRAAAAAERKKVTRHALNQALRTLHLDPPKRGQALATVLAQAKKQQRALARTYHPDALGGSDHLRGQYQAVIEAFVIVEQYVKENESPATPPNLRVVKGGRD
jgi:hypothetical protein